MSRSTVFPAVALAALVLSARSPLLAQSVRTDPSPSPAATPSQPAPATEPADADKASAASPVQTTAVAGSVTRRDVVVHKAMRKRAHIAAVAAKAHRLNSGAISDDPESRPIGGYRSGQKSSGAEDSGSLVMSVIGKLALVVGLIFACAAGWKRWHGGMPQVGTPVAAGVKVTSTIPLGPQRHLHVVTVGRRQLLLASSPQNICLLTILEAPDDSFGMAAPAALAAYHDAREPAPAARVSGAAVESAGQPAPADRFEELLLRLRQLESAATVEPSPESAAHRQARASSSPRPAGSTEGEPSHAYTVSPRPPAEGAAATLPPSPGTLFRMAPAGVRRGLDA